MCVMLTCVCSCVSCCDLRVVFTCLLFLCALGFVLMRVMCVRKCCNCNVWMCARACCKLEACGLVWFGRVFGYVSCLWCALCRDLGMGVLTCVCVCCATEVSVLCSRREKSGCAHVQLCVSACVILLRCVCAYVCLLIIFALLSAIC